MSVLETRRFPSRREAGRALADQLSRFADQQPVVIGLARGGVPVAYEVAQAFGAPLDVLVVRKIGAPGNPEYAIGAVAEGGERVLNDGIGHLLISAEELEAATARAEAQLENCVARYREHRPSVELRGRTAIVVDDGLATGATARAALRAVRARNPRRLVLAIPVGTRETVESLREEADEVICLVEPELMWAAVGQWYERFEPTGDDEVRALLAGAAEPEPAVKPSSTEVRICLDGVWMFGELVVPETARGLVVSAHAGSSGRYSPRDRQLAGALNERGLGTLQLDLLTVEEERSREYAFDIGLLAGRLVFATQWLQSQARFAEYAVGYLAANNAAAAALRAAAELGDKVSAVVSRGGRPDLAAHRLSGVRAPVLLIVGGKDQIVLDLNRKAQKQLADPSKLSVVAAATHLLEEPEALEEVSSLAGEWFELYLPSAQNPSLDDPSRDPRRRASTAA